MDLDITQIDFEDIVKQCWVEESKSSFHPFGYNTAGIDHILLECYIAHKGWNINHYCFITGKLKELGYQSKQFKSNLSS